MSTVLDALLQSLTNAAAYNPATERPPVIVLWPDGEQKWRPALPQL